MHSFGSLLGLYRLISLSAQWLPRVLTWMVDDGARERGDDMEVIALRLATIYSEAQMRQGAHQKVRSTFPRMLKETLLTITLIIKHRLNAIPIVKAASIVGLMVTENAGSAGPYDHLADRTQILDALRSGLVDNVLALLVACSGFLSSEDYKRLNGALWNDCLDHAAPRIQRRVGQSSCKRLSRK
jgi:hypothetical protein